MDTLALDTWIYKEKKLFFNIFVQICLKYVFF